MGPEREKTVLLPMRVSVLLAGRNGMASAGNLFDYTTIFSTGSTDHVESQPVFSIERDVNRLEKGAHLHWQLPAALTVGRQEKDGSVTFSPVPDRFLVTRLIRREDKLETRHWLVESSFLSDDDSSPENRRSPTVYYQQDREFFCRFLGRSCSFDQGAPLPEAGREYLSPLTAVMPGNPTFAAYYPGCRNVFGFHDSLSDVQGEAEICYLVCGWYESPEQDPLRSYTDAEALLRERGVSLTGELPERPRALCHGAAGGLSWKGEDAPYFPNLPERFPETAAAENSAQAMDALNGGGDGLSAMNLLMEGALSLLLETDGSREAEYQELSSCFSSETPGNVYTIRVKPEREPLPDAGEEALHRRAGVLLTALNRQERLRSRLEHDLTELRRHIYCLWQKMRMSGQRDLAAQIRALGGEIPQRLAEIRGVEDTAASLLSQLSALLGEEFSLTETPDDPFYAPVDPVLLLRGEAAEQQDTGEEPLPCRLAAETLIPKTRFSYTCSPADCPEAYPLLLDEAVLLWQGETPLRGTPPAKPAFCTGTAPWESITLSWDVLYRPDERLLRMEDPLKSWTLSGIDYRLEGEWEEKALYEIQGSILLTPHVPHILRHMLRKLALGAKSRELRERLLSLSEQAGELPVKSQRLSGFHQRLLTRKTALSFPVDDFGDAPDPLQRQTALWVGDEYRYLPDTEMFLNHFRGGSLEIARLSLVDIFGRVKPGVPLEVKVPADLSLGSCRMELPPRIVEPCRISLRFLSWDGAGYSIEDSRFLSPVLAWLVLDRTDRSLMLYAPDGAYLGKLAREGEQVRLEPPPGGDTSPGGKAPSDGDASPDSAASPQEEAQAFIRAALSGKWAEMERLIRCIERCPGVLNPKGGEMSKNFALFAGKPVALVKASLRLTLIGTPAVSNGVEGKSPEGLSLPVYLGDGEHINEGLVGFFKESEGYGRFYTHLDGASDSALTLRLEKEDGGPPHAGGLVTLLMEPCSPVHVISGILPVLSAKLPENLIKSVCDHILFSRRTGPVVSPRERTEAAFWSSDGVAARWMARTSSGGWTDEVPDPPGQMLTEETSALLEGYLVYRQTGEEKEE